MRHITDKDFEATFYTKIVGGPGFQCIDALHGAHGVIFACPCGGHTMMIPFANPRGVTREHPVTGWQMQGSGLHDLTLTPSILVDSGHPQGSCWHGFITAGEIITCQ